MAQSNKEKQIAVLIKQKNELDAEFEDVLHASKASTATVTTPARKQTVVNNRRGSAALTRKATASAA